MNIYLISEYVNRMQKQDVNNFAIKQGITLDNEELDIIYIYIKNPKVILEEIKYQVKPLTYNKIENLYMQFKDKIDNFTKNIKGY